MVDQQTILMVDLVFMEWTSQHNHKKVIAPLEGGPEFASNEEVGEWESCTKYYLGNFKI